MPFKVICIGNPGLPERGTSQHPGNFRPVEGETYTVLYTIKSVKGYMVHLLREDPFHMDYGWFVELFAPLSDIDETTFERNYQTEKA